MSKRLPRLLRWLDARRWRNLTIAGLLIALPLIGCVGTDETPLYLITAQPGMSPMPSLPPTPSAAATPTSAPLSPTPVLPTTALAPALATSTTLPSLGYSPVASNRDWTPILQSFDGVVMALVPAGCFSMGSQNGDEEASPTNLQCFERPFWIDRTEVTNAQFGSQGLVPGPDRPRDSVNYLDASAWCAQRGARLPTEAEWEYAARGPDGLIYPWGDTFDPDNAVYVLNAQGQSANVGSHPGGASWVGALDMAGNVWEWTSTLYAPYPYDPLDGRENPDDWDSPRVIRGGSYDNEAPFLRTSTRKAKHPLLEWYGYVGFRCVRPADLQLP